MLRRLGQGGMGAVYLARHLGTQGDVALKVLHETAIGDENAVRRFKVEAENVAALKHTNTVRVMDFGVDHATLYLVMEYLAGDTLADVLVRDGALPWPRAVHILRQVLKSLWEAHEHPKRIIHRDIKPANIFLVDLPGEPDHVRVLDFGISRALDGTGAGTVGALGTPAYMAPELWRGEVVDARTDLYALGCVAYQMLAGEPPFVPPPSAASSIFPLLDMHLHAAPPSLDKVRANLNVSASRAAVSTDVSASRAAVSTVPKPLADYVTRLLEKEPSKRPPSAKAALEALDDAVRAIADPPPQSSAEGFPDTPTAPDAKPRPTKSTAMAHHAPVAKKARPTWPRIVIALVLIAGLGGMIWFVSRAPSTGPNVSVTTPHPEFGALRLSYRARLSAADHLDEKGAPLHDAAAVVTLDRRRFHAGVGDPEDGADSLFQNDDMQAQLYRLVAHYLDTPTRRAILEGRPLIEVLLYEGGLTLRVVAD